MVTIAFVYLLLLRVGENSLQQAWAILVSDPSLHYLMKYVRTGISIIATYKVTTMLAFTLIFIVHICYPRTKKMTGLKITAIIFK